MISDEMTLPYKRPPLSKEVWFDTDLGVEHVSFRKWNGEESSLLHEAESFYVDPEKLLESKYGGVSVIRGYSVTTISAEDQKVILDDGSEITYDKCLLSTGSSPKNADVFSQASAKVKERVHTFKTMEDFKALKHRLEDCKSIAIIGNGFLGSELACSLARFGQEKGLKVYQVFHEDGNMSKVLPEYLSRWTTERI